METRYRVLGLGLVGFLYLGVVLWPRKVERKPLPPPPPPPSASVGPSRPPIPMPTYAAAGSSGAGFSERPDINVPPKPRIPLTKIPVAVAPAAGDGSPFRAYKPRKPGEKAVPEELAPWADPSGKPVAYRSDPKTRQERAKNPAERSRDRGNRKRPEKLQKNNQRMQAMMRREGRVQQFQQQVQARRQELTR